MKTFKKFFFLTVLVTIVFASFSTETQAQTRQSDAPAIVFSAENMDEWQVAKIPSRIPDGEIVLATYKKNRTQVIALVRDGKIAQVGHKAVTTIPIIFHQSANANASACSPAGLCYSWQLKRCFIMPWGQCICICGTWITAG